MNIDNKVNSTVGLLEAFEERIRVLEECVASITDPSYHQLAVVTIEDIEGLLKIFEDSLNPLELCDQINLSGNQYKSMIYKLGIESEVVKLREAGDTIANIAARFSMSTRTISRFFKHFDSLSLITKAKIKNSSVMNTTDRLEELMAMILRQLNKLEGLDNETHVKYIGELRQTIGLAAQISEKIATYTAYKEFSKAVENILLAELPERRLEIIQRLKELQGGGTQTALPLNPLNRN